MRLLVVRVLASVLLAMATDSIPMRTARTMMSLTKMSDLEGAASGYAYDQRQSLPVSYVQYTSHGPGPYAYTDYGQYDDGLGALAPYYPLVHHYESPYQLHDRLDEHRHQQRGEDGSFEEGEGSERRAEDNSAHGEREEKGYGSQHEFDRGENEDREAAHQEGEYKEEAGHEGGHDESNSEYDAHDEAEAGQEGANFGKKAYRKKGHRTSGFHNVYHKDEYKKDTDFYDEDHNGGHYENYGAFDAHRKDEAAGYEKGGKHDSAYDLGKHGQEGYHNKGLEHNLRKGHQGAEGEDTYREEHTDYDKKAARHHANQHGFKQAHGYR
ncbi:PREDICTED: protein argonaute-2-like [Ceratosolen solmsi marchali]|uniref:Protein argonaute-2-like n=1 Tax=Ceratosolen solmsi marchali TaxID=326594 RepID=A0AAJ6YNU0_9HYME|nr:PREDICTED: protein argonaute-2-like [Ceratosolen solmsi marchali]